jgi:hypothetical protein
MAQAKRGTMMPGPRHTVDVTTEGRLMTADEVSADQEICGV